MRRHPPQLVNPADVVAQAFDRQLGVRGPKQTDRRIAATERLLARHDREIAENTAATRPTPEPETLGPSGPPSIAAQTAAGTTATATITGNDEEGIIVLVPGGAGIATGVQAAVTFALARKSAHYTVMLQPFSSAARTAGATVGPTSRASSGWSITTGTALSSGSTYQWLYRVGKEYA